MRTGIIENAATAAMAHEDLIRKVFHGEVFFSGGKTVFDHPLYLIGFTNRSGSNLLASHLRTTGRLNGFYEHLNHDEVERMQQAFQADSFPDFLQRLSAMSSRNGEMVGFKASWDQLRMLLRWNIDKMYAGGIRMIHTAREDLVEQAVSFSIARQTRQWSSNQQAQGEAIYDENDIALRLEAIMHANQMFHYLTSIAGIPMTHIRYGELCDDPATVMRRIGEFAEVDLSDWSYVEPEIKKQGGKINTEFRDRFAAEHIGMVRASQSFFQQEEESPTKIRKGWRIFGR